MRSNISCLLILFMTCCTYSCKKEAEKKYCWQLVDQLGNEVALVCDKTEAELHACVNNGTCVTYSSGSLSPCSFYKVEGEEFCWFINNTYMLKATENKLAHLRKCFNFTSTAVKVDCDYCQFWYNRLKSTSKPDGKIIYSPITHQQYCGDTTLTLYQGRQIVLKNDGDSLIVIQFSKDGANW